jgi:hypothetical protein
VQTLYGEYGITEVLDVPLSAFTVGTSPHKCYPPFKWGKIVAQVVRQHGYKLVGNYLPGLRRCILRYALCQFSAMRHGAEPMSYGFKEVQVIRREGIYLR